MSLRLTPPEPVDVVSAEEVRAIIATTDRELAELERAVSEAMEIAESAEARAREAGADGRASMWAMLRMQRFLDGLRGETEAEVTALLDVARGRARVRLEEARAEADAILNRATPRDLVPELAPMPATELAGEAPVEALEAPVVEAPLVVVPQVVEPPLAEEAVADEPAADTDDVAFAPTAPAPETNGHVVGPTALVVDDLAPVEERVSEPFYGLPDGEQPYVPQDTAAPPVEHAIDGAPERWDMVLPATQSPAAVVEADATAPAMYAADHTEAAPTYANAQPDFWPTENPAPRKRRFRIPISAVLEVLAVLLILVFILLRLS
jgi:hypothetical protein